MTQIYEIEDEFSICDENCQKLEKLLFIYSVIKNLQTAPRPPPIAI